MIKKLRLVSIAVPELDAALEFFRDALGLQVDSNIEDPHHALKRVHLKVGETALALLQPIEDESPVGRFLQERGSALYHLGFEVEDIELTMRTLLARGAELLDREPREVPGGRIAFVRPRGDRGVLVELWEPNPEGTEAQPDFASRPPVPELPPGSDENGGRPHAR